ncbi:MAG: DJ-1/PfpI family protein [Treponema sp.]|nr:DJ-1/PfpI family protein [Treponema sp.]
MKKAAVFLADGFEEVEALTPVDYLRRAGVEVITVAIPSPTTKKETIVTGSHKIPVIADTTLKEYLSKYGEAVPEMVFCPGGGRGAENLSNCTELLEHLEKCAEKGRYISAICASPAVVLGKTKIPDGKNWTCYPGMQTESNPAYQPNYENKVFVTDGNLITARGAGAAEEFAMELIRLLCGADVAKKIHDGTVQR